MNLSSKIGLKEVDFKNKRVLIRVDFNVPLSKKGGQYVVRDTTRIDSTIPTLKYILEKGAKSLVLMSHLGRPDGRALMEYSMAPTIPVLEKALGRKVTFLDDCVGAHVEEVCRNPTAGSVILLENLRFHVEEEGSGIDADGKKFKADKQEVTKFRKSLSSLGDIFVNDAFGTAHRAHSSMVGINLPIKAAGFLMHKELNEFAKCVENPQRPFLAVLGGAKVADKIQLIENLLDKVDEMIIGGAMAFTFLKTLDNVKIGNSLFDEAGSKIVHRLVEKAKAKNVKLHLPVDFVIGDKLKGDSKVQRVYAKAGIPDGWYGLDCGPTTALNNAQVIWRAKTVVFNGPQGVFENPSFSGGTINALHACAAACQLGKASVIIGGGDSVAAATEFGVTNLVTHVSTGGGASLELLEGKQLPGVVALSDKQAAVDKLRANL